MTDSGSHFTSEAFKVMGIHHLKSAPYHPASNGLAKRFIQSLKQSLKASVNDGCTLTQRLCSYLLAYRTTPHSTTGAPPCQLFMNRELRTRLSLLRPDRDSTVLDKQATQKSSHDRRAYDRELVVGDCVFARNLRAGPEWVLSTVVEVLGPVTYIIETDEGLRWKRHANH